jgi:hypothetical protein
MMACNHGELRALRVVCDGLIVRPTRLRRSSSCSCGKFTLKGRIDASAATARRAPREDLIAAAAVVVESSSRRVGAREMTATWFSCVEPFIRRLPG